MNNVDLIIRSAQQGHLSALVGAAVSKREPACSPGWYQFRDEVVGAILDFLMENEVREDTISSSVAEAVKESEIRPEHIFEGIDRFGGNSHVHALVQTVALGQPNIAHCQLASLMSKGFLAHIMTSNWDTYVEQACKDKGVQLVPVFPGADYGSLTENEPHLVYLHGSLEDKGKLLQASIFRLGFELFPPIKACLSEIIATTDCLVIGYSGSDWDILEALRACMKKSSTSLFWVYNTEVSEGVRQLRKEFGDRVKTIKADLYTLLSDLCNILGVHAGPVSLNPTPDRMQLLKERTRRLHCFTCYLTLAYICSMVGRWWDAAFLCEYALDASLSKTLNPNGALISLSREAYRFEAVFRAFTKDFQMAEYLLHQAQSAEMKSVSAFIEYSELVDIQRVIILLCQKRVQKAKDIILRIFNMLGCSNYTGLPIVHHQWQMYVAKVYSLLATTLSITNEPDDDLLDICQKALDAQRYARNLFDYCASLLALSLVHNKRGEKDRALSLLQECGKRSAEFGNEVCMQAANANKALLLGDGKTTSLISSIIDTNTGWHLTTDPFALFYTLPEDASKIIRGM